MKNTKQLITIEGYITEVTEPQEVTLPDSKSFIQSNVTFETEDGQRAYFEIRKKIIEQLQASDINPDTKVRIGFVMLGCIKKGNKFNRMYINKLELA